MTDSVEFCLLSDSLNGILLLSFNLDMISMKNCIVGDMVMTLQVPAKVLCNLWSYHIYFVALSLTE